MQQSKSKHTQYIYVILFLEKCINFTNVLQFYFCSQNFRAVEFSKI